MNVKFKLLPGKAKYEYSFIHLDSCKKENAKPENKWTQMNVRRKIIKFSYSVGKHKHIHIHTLLHSFICSFVHLICICI